MLRRSRSSAARRWETFGSWSRKTSAAQPETTELLRVQLPIQPDLGDADLYHESQ